jgi:hypothetical protein
MTQSNKINVLGDLAKAINESVSYTISVDINGATIGEVRDMLAGLDIEESDDARLEDGVYDIWGARADGQEFRLTLTETEA